MSVEDTVFSPPATAVMFLLTIHPTTLEAGDFLSTGVKFRHVPEAFPYYRLFFSAWQAMPETGKVRRFLFSHLPTGFGDFLRILFFRPGSVSGFLRCGKIGHNPRHLGYFRDFCVLGAAVYLIHRGCDDKALRCRAARKRYCRCRRRFFRMRRSDPLLATALS